MGIFREGWHCDYKVFDFSEYPTISSTVSESATSESVYVRYYRNDIPLDQPQKEVTVRFSLHESNASKFGDVLNQLATEDEVLFYLGYATRTFIPAFRPFIATEQIKRKNIPNYEQAELTIQEMYALGIGADLTSYVGKVANGSNYLIVGNSVEKFYERRQNILGEWVNVGRYEYKRIPYPSTTSMTRFTLQPSDEPGFWVATDTEHGMVVRFKEHEFNQTHKPTLLNGDEFHSVEEALKYATYISELADWLAAEHQNIVF